MFALVLCAPIVHSRSARAEETHAVVTAPASVPVGQAASVGVTIEGKNGWHINAEAPVSLKVTPKEGVTLAKPALGRADLVESNEKRARFDVRATPASAGTITLAAEASFVMCQETACKPVREKLTLQLAAQAADGNNKSADGAPPPGAKGGKTKGKSPRAKSSS